MGDEFARVAHVVGAKLGCVGCLVLAEVEDAADDRADRTGVRMITARVANSFAADSVLLVVEGNGDVCGSVEIGERTRVKVELASVERVREK